MRMTSRTEHFFHLDEPCAWNAQTESPTRHTNKPKLRHSLRRRINASGKEEQHDKVHEHHDAQFNDDRAAHFRRIRAFPNRLQCRVSQILNSSIERILLAFSSLQLHHDGNIFELVEPTAFCQMLILDWGRRNEFENKPSAEKAGKQAHL